MRNRIFDCITFFDNNYMFNLRYNILKNYVDYFVICESLYDHRGNKKNINFNKNKDYESSKIKHLILEEPFPNNNVWENQALQREYLLKNLQNAEPEDYIFFSDPDEIPRPEILINFKLNKKYGIFKQKCFNYKFNLFNKYESPWEGTRVAKKKNLHSIDFMRQKIRSKNLNYSFLRVDKEKNIQIFDNGGWHFNNILSPKEISTKLKTFAHIEFANEKFSSIDLIEKKINEKKDLFNRGHEYQKVEIDSNYPKYIRENLDKFQKFIL
jgi:beta-1,4-mannosyl-glycoprotein beta-1,4-N-acetylglucosaminyltransferase